MCVIVTVSYVTPEQNRIDNFPRGFTRCPGRKQKIAGLSGDGFTPGRDNEIETYWRCYFKFRFAAPADTDARTGFRDDSGIPPEMERFRKQKWRSRATDPPVILSQSTIAH